MIGEITLIEGDVVECVAYTGPNDHYTVGKLYNVTEHRGVPTVANNGGTRSYEEKARFKLMRADCATYKQLRDAEATIKRLKAQVEAKPVVPDNIEQAYLDGFGAATTTAQSVQLRVSPGLDDAIALGISSVANILEAQLTKFETQRAEGR